MTLSSRRKFIANAAVAGVASCFLPVIGTSAVNTVRPEKKWKNNAVILFQGDSITDGNRGRNEDPNHIMGHGYAVVPVEKYEETYGLLLEQTQSQFPEILFVLCEPFILKVGRVAENWEVCHAYIDKRREVVKKLVAKYNAVFVPSQEVFNKACEKAPAEYWMWDGVHPTVAGHELLAREWLKQVENRISF